MVRRVLVLPHPTVLLHPVAAPRRSTLSPAHSVLLTTHTADSGWLPQGDYPVRPLYPTHILGGQVCPVVPLWYPHPLATPATAPATRLAPLLHPHQPPLSPIAHLLPLCADGQSHRRAGVPHPMQRKRSVLAMPCSALLLLLLLLVWPGHASGAGRVVQQDVHGLTRGQRDLHARRCVHSETWQLATGRSAHCG